eukprot:jgi/Hompol1/3460/HPOL_006546-RA
MPHSNGLDLVDRLHRLPAELRESIYSLVPILTKYLHDELPLPLSPWHASLVWVECFEKDLLHLARLLPRKGLSWEFLFLHSVRMADIVAKFDGLCYNRLTVSGLNLFASRASTSLVATIEQATHSA